MSLGRGLRLIFYIIEKCKTIFFIKTFAKKREKSSKIENVTKILQKYYFYITYNIICCFYK